MEHSKSVFAVIAVSFIILFGLFLIPSNSNTKEVSAEDFLRIHIRANSNDIEDQTIKYKVKDEIVLALTPLLANAETKKESMEIVSKNINYLQSVANQVLKENGFNYLSKAEIRNEYFPTRHYNSITLKSGEYDSLILELGEGKGDNWWCVAYPPLCFINYDSDNSSNIVYKSKLVEIIEKFFNKG